MGAAQHAASGAPASSRAGPAGGAPAGCPCAWVPEERDSGLARLRPAAVAGSFYPSDAARLAAEVERLLRDAVSVQQAHSLHAPFLPHPHSTSPTPHAPSSI